MLTLATTVAAQPAEEPKSGGTDSLAESPADDTRKVSCARAYEMSQRLRQEGRLKQAKEQALICAQPACPAVLVGDCTDWMLQLERAVPSVVVEVRDASGRAISDVSVSVDGQALTSALDGRALTLDPGQRLFKVTLPGGRSLARTVIVTEGQQGQRVSFALPPQPGEPIQVRKRSGLSPLVYATGALGVLGVSGFAYFGLSGKGDERTLERRCAPRCTDSELAPLRQRYLAADISLGVGVAALSLFGYLWLTHEEDPSTGLHAVVSPQGASLGLRERF